MSIERRALLAGAAAAAGLVIGGGAVELGNTLAASPGPGTGPDVASPGEELMVEHGVLKRILLAYRAVIERLDRPGDQVDPGVIIDGAQIVADYVESFHEGLEEAYVFPRVADQNDDLAGLVRTLLVQHDRGRHLTAAIQQAAGGDVRRTATRTAIRNDLAAFVRMYEPHEAWEDTVIYPALRRGTAQRTLDLLAERFADLENDQYGDDALDGLLARVGGIEQQLGIGDLATFTPDAR